MRGEVDRAQVSLGHSNTSQHQHRGNEYSDATTAGKSWSARQQALYHRPAICIMPGEMLFGGLAMRFPVLGFTIGMALVPDRIAEGW